MLLRFSLVHLMDQSDTFQDGVLSAEKALFWGDDGTQTEATQGRCIGVRLYAEKGN